MHISVKDIKVATLSGNNLIRMDNEEPQLAASATPLINLEGIKIILVNWLCNSARLKKRSHTHFIFKLRQATKLKIEFLNSSKNFPSNHNIM